MQSEKLITEVKDFTQDSTLKKISITKTGYAVKIVSLAASQGANFYLRFDNEWPDSIYSQYPDYASGASVPGKLFILYGKN